MIRALFRPYFNVQLLCCACEIIIPLFLYTNWSTFALHFFFGCGLWNLTEYVYHRFLQHTFFYASHKNHHVYPVEKKYIHLSLLLTQGFAPFFIYLLYDTLGILSGFIFSGLIFETSHFISHNYLDNRVTKTLFKETKRFHALHHKDPSCNFGFLTPTYDYVFNTCNSKTNYSMFIIVTGSFLPVLLFVPMFSQQ